MLVVENAEEREELVAERVEENPNPNPNPKKARVRKRQLRSLVLREQRNVNKLNSFYPK
jgi:hypothetical protein